MCLFLLRLFDCIFLNLTSTMRGDHLNELGLCVICEVCDRIPLYELVETANGQVADMIANNDITGDRIKPFKRMMGIFINIMSRGKTAKWDAMLKKSAIVPKLGDLGEDFMIYLARILISRMYTDRPTVCVGCVLPAVCPFVKKAALGMLRELGHKDDIELRNSVIDHIEFVSNLIFVCMMKLPVLLE